MGGAPAACASDAYPDLSPGPDEGVEALGACVEAAQTLSTGQSVMRARAAADATCKRKSEFAACRGARQLESDAVYRDLIEAGEAARGAQRELVFALDLSRSCRWARDRSDICTNYWPTELDRRREEVVKASKRLAKEARNVSPGR